jgi:hypothetical protein
VYAPVHLHAAQVHASELRCCSGPHQLLACKLTIAAAPTLQPPAGLAVPKPPVYVPARDGTPHMFQLQAVGDAVSPNTGKSLKQQPLSRSCCGEGSHARTRSCWYLLYLIK